MKTFVYVLRLADGNMTGTVQAESAKEALVLAFDRCAGSWKLPLAEAIIVEPTLPIGEAEAREPRKMVLSAFGMAATLSNYRMATERAQDGRDIELARRELVDWLERYRIGVDFTGEKEIV